MTKKQTMNPIEALKELFKITQQELEEINGLDHCKNCGINFGGLEELLNLAITETATRTRQEDVRAIEGITRLASIAGHLEDPFISRNEAIQKLKSLNK